MFTKFNRVLLVSGLAIGATALISPMAMAGAGGIAGSASFNLVDSSGSQVVSGVATAAAVGKNGASAWGFQSGTTNSAGALGSGGVITVTGMTATTFTSVVDAVDGNLDTAQTNTLSGGPDVQLGTTSGDVVVDATP